MSESKFTPGPWSVIEGGPTTMYIDDEFGLEGGRDYYLADVTHGDPVELIANARLIAVAPCLLKALQAAVAFIDSHVADPDLNSDMAAAYSTYLDCDAKSIIAKATASPMGKE